MNNQNQKALIELGKKYGYIDSNMVARFYNKQDGIRTMNKLVNGGYFSPPIDNDLKIIWKFLKE